MVLSLMGIYEYKCPRIKMEYRPDEPENITVSYY
jgi:hypothetical protein